MFIRGSPLCISETLASETLKISCHLTRKKLLKLFAGFLGAFVLLLVLLIVFHKPLLRWSAHAWIVDHSSVEKVDAVIIPGGGLETRPFGAAKWYHAGKTKRLVTFNVEAPPTEELGITQPAHELTLEVLNKLKIPRDTVEVIAKSVSSTQDEVIATRKWAEKNEIKSIAIMTEIFPSRRVNWAYENGFNGSDVEISVVALSPLRYTADNWWLHEEGLISFQNAIIKYFYYLVRY